LQTQIPDIDYDVVADKIANRVNTPEITEADYLKDSYFKPIFFYLKTIIYLQATPLPEKYFYCLKY